MIPVAMIPPPAAAAAVNRSASSSSAPRTAADVMTRPVRTLRPCATLREAAALFGEAGISGAPVVNEAGDLVGVVSEGDLLDAARREAALPRFALFGAVPIAEETLKRAFDDGWRLMVQSVMTRRVQTADENTPLADLARLMVRGRINRVPVLRGGGSKQVVGIVTREDLLRAYAAPTNPKDTGP